MILRSATIVILTWHTAIFAHDSGFCGRILENRHLRVAPLRSDQEGSWSRAFVLANLVGQVTGRAVSPEDIALQAGASLSQPLSVSIQALEQRARRKGFCLAAVFNRALYGIGPDGGEPDGDWNSLLQRQFKGKSRAEFLGMIDSVCGPRERLMPSEYLVVEQPTIKRIDEVLESGRFVAAGKSLRYFTIIGKQGHHYVIQDSVAVNGEYVRHLTGAELVHATKEIAFYSPDSISLIQE